LHGPVGFVLFQARSLDPQRKLLNSTGTQFKRHWIDEKHFAEAASDSGGSSRPRTQIETTFSKPRPSMNWVAARSSRRRCSYDGRKPQSLSHLAPLHYQYGILPKSSPPLPSEFARTAERTCSSERRMASANAQIGWPRAALSAHQFGRAGGFERAFFRTRDSGPSACVPLERLHSQQPTPPALLGPTIFTWGGVARLQTGHLLSTIKARHYRQTVRPAFQQVEKRRGIGSRDTK